MAVQRKIRIVRTDRGVTYDPAVLDARTGDQIFWSNNDSEPHWPGLVEDGRLSDPSFFMTNQIAPGSTSPIFSPGKPSTIEYRCSIHGGDTGSIDVS